MSLSGGVERTIWRQKRRHTGPKLEKNEIKNPPITPEKITLG